MKRALAIILHSSLFILHYSPAAEVVVYSPPSTSPLHVAVMSTNDMTTSGARVFPASYTGHRAVCVMPDATTNDTFCAWIGGDAFAPGDPFGVSSGRDYPAIKLTRSSAITPRMSVFSLTADRDEMTAVSSTTNVSNLARFDYTLPSTPSVRVRVLRYKVDDFNPFEVGTHDARVIIDRMFQRDVLPVIHEGDILKDGKFDIDWDLLYPEVVNNRGVIAAGGVFTNVSYLVVFGEGSVDYSTMTSNSAVKNVHPFLISRRFGLERIEPTAVDDGVCRHPRKSFRWRIVGEDAYSSRFGTTYTAFKLKLWSGAGTNGTPTVSTNIVRMPPEDVDGVISYPLDYQLSNHSTYTWKVFTYNSKFKEDGAGSTPQTFTTEFN